jgi:gamma-glutamyltranspeptidase/glutathione hydrolase
MKSQMRHCQWTGTTRDWLFSVFAIALFLPSLAWAAFPHPETGEKGMVTSANAQASAVGVDILKKGGNAVDAAVATAFAISVVEPFSAGIGGGGFLVMYTEQDAKVRSLDFRERAPLAASRDMYLDENGKVRPGASVDGHRAVAVPGTVAGLFEVHTRYGRLPWKDVVEPAIALAENGFAVRWRFVEACKWRLESLKKNPEASRIFFKNGKLLKEGELLVQKDLGNTLRQVAADPFAFYAGPIADAMVADMEKNGGLITHEDLKSYKPVWRKPVCGKALGARLCAMPPPSSGGVHILQILNLLAETDFSKRPRHDPTALHLLVEAMRTAYADRAVHLGDPAFFNVPVNALTSRAYAKSRIGEISMDKARSANEVVAATDAELEKLKKKLAREKEHTTHLNVVDSGRNAVSMTFTVNYGFGAGVVAPGTGILLNNEMDDFSAAPGVPNVYGLVGGEANAIAPTKIPLSSMTPTILLQDRKLKASLGSPGGSTIITTNLQATINILLYGMDAATAVAAPRLHQQWLPDVLRVELHGLDPLTAKSLEKRGHKLDWRTGWGNANAIVVRPDGVLEGGVDPRGDGGAKGY